MSPRRTDVLTPPTSALRDDRTVAGATAATAVLLLDGDRDTHVLMEEALEEKEFSQGLAICHSVVVDKRGGTIDFETQEGKGTTFVVRLPIRAPDTPGGD